MNKKWCSTNRSDLEAEVAIRACCWHQIDYFVKLHFVQWRWSNLSCKKILIWKVLWALNLITSGMSFLHVAICKNLIKTLKLLSKFLATIVDPFLLLSLVFNPLLGTSTMVLTCYLPLERAWERPAITFSYKEGLKITIRVMVGKRLTCKCWITSNKKKWVLILIHTTVRHLSINFAKFCQNIIRRKQTGSMKFNFQYCSAKFSSSSREKTNKIKKRIHQPMSGWMGKLLFRLPYPSVIYVFSFWTCKK